MSEPVRRLRERDAREAKSVASSTNGARIRLMDTFSVLSSGNVPMEEWKIIQLHSRILRNAGFDYVPEPDHASPEQAHAALHKLTGAFDDEDNHNDVVYEDEAGLETAGMRQ